jgi:hypothetical protein
LTRSPATKAEQESFQRLLQVAPFLAQFGIVRLTDMGAATTRELPAQQRAEMTAFLVTPKLLATMLAEMETWTATTDQTRSAGSLGTRSLFVLSAGVDQAGDSHPLQAEMASLSSNSVQHTVDQATHQSLVIRQEDAEATSGAILQVVEAVRTGAALP